MNMKHRIAVVIPNWNGQEFLGQCLDALKKQTVEHKVFVVDNGSIDNSKEIISNSQAEGIYLDKNYGFAGGVNRGIERAIDEGFEFVYLLNNDAKPASNVLEILLDKALSDKRIGIVTGKFLTFDGKKLDSTGDFYSTWGLPYPRGRGSTDLNAYDEATDIFGATGGASLYRCEMIKDIGLFDEDFFAYFEDVDLSFRAQLRSWKVVFEPKAKVFHHIGGTSKKLKGFATYNSFKNLPWLLIKNVPPGYLFKFGWRFMLARAFFMVSAIFRGEGLHAIKGDWQATKGLPKKWQQRRAVQGRSTASNQEIIEKIYPGIPSNYLRLRSIANKISGPSQEDKHKKPIIAIDLRCLDGPSKYRGIGKYLQDLLSLLIPKLTKDYTVRLYIQDPNNLEGIDKKALSSCEVMEVKKSLLSHLPDKLFRRAKMFLPSSQKTTRKLPMIEEAGLFLQTYIENGVSKNKNTKTLSIAYDLIPLLFADQYFNRSDLGYDPKSWLVRLSRTLDKFFYVRGLRGYNNSTKVISISENTKETLVESLGVKEESIEVSYPGVPDASTSAGEKFDPPKTPYIVYVGGIDYRRDLIGLVEAFEILRSKADFKLVLAGRDFDDLHDKKLTKKLAESKFRDDIIIHGYISEQAKHTLMRQAVALVYPTLYEGFGIPIVEAFRDSCPLITYRNSSVVEAAGDAAIYAESPEQIAEAVIKLQNNKEFRAEMIKAGLEQSKKFTWQKAAQDYHEIIKKMIKND